MTFGRIRKRDIFSFVGGTFIFQGTKFLADFFSANTIGPKLWGDWFLLYTIMTFCPVIAMGIFNGSVLKIPQLIGSQEKKTLEFVTDFAVFFGVSLSLFMALISIVFWIFIPDKKYAIVLMISSVFFLYTMSNSITRSYGLFETLSASFVILSSGYLLLPLSAYLFHSIEIFSVIFFFSYLVVSFFLLKKLRVSKVTKSVSDFLKYKGVVKELISKGFPITLIGLSFVMYTSVDRILISYFFGTKELGYYSIAVMLTLGVLMIPKTISQMIYPRLSNIWGKYKNVKGLKYWISKSRFYAAISIIPVSIAVFVLSDFIIDTFMNTYESSLPFIKILILSTPTYILIAGHGDSLNILNRQKQSLIIIVISVLFNLLVSYLLFLYLESSISIAIGTVISNYFYAFALVIYSNKELKRIRF